MSVGEALRDLGRFLDECESRRAVTSVELSEGGDADGTEPLTAEVGVELSTRRSDDRDTVVSLRETTVDPDGGLRLTFGSDTPVLPTADHDVDVAVTEASLADGTVTATLSATVRVDDASAGEDAIVEAPATPTEGVDESTTGTRENDVPPFRDPELLADVYDSCDTFAEMTDAIGMDVTAETVRRYMIDHGIHEPNSYDTDDGTDAATGGDGTGEDDPGMAVDGDEEQVVLADGIGLPEDVTVENLIETVKRSNTIFEVKRDIGIEREDALEMLRELNLLDLVVGRLGTEAERDISREEVIERLRETSGAGQ